jgi:hypothetical protein
VEGDRYEGREIYTSRRKAGPVQKVPRKIVFGYM